jgi:hypothetical protein
MENSVGAKIVKYNNKQREFYGGWWADYGPT